MGGVAACGDDNSLLSPASSENTTRAFSVFALSGSAPALPAAYKFTSESLERPQVLSNGAVNFDVAFDITSDNADFIKRNNVNLSKAVDVAIREMRRLKAREEWAIENQAALAERCRLIDSEGGTAAERFYGAQPVPTT